ncbi:acyl-protein thioesterase [Nemania sp. FL0916]|nr:acyl-protein thioesterase [Nemania sp. FL0916]
MDLAVRVIEPTTRHTHTVVIPTRPCSENYTLIEAFPSFRWVFPQSLLRDCIAIPGNKWSQWFDIWDTRDFSKREDVQAEGLRESVASIRRIILTEIASLGGRSDRIILAGISQGAATAVHTLLNLDLPQPPVLNNTDTQQQQDALGHLAAFLGFSCRMPFPGRPLAEVRRILSIEGAPQGDEDGVLRHTPMLLEHCKDDMTVPITSGRVLRDTLRGYGIDVAWREYFDGGHWFHSPLGIDDAIAFIKARVLDIPPGNAYVGTLKPEVRPENDVDMDIL